RMLRRDGGGPTPLRLSSSQPSPSRKAGTAGAAKAAARIAERTVSDERNPAARPRRAAHRGRDPLHRVPPRGGRVQRDQGGLEVLERRPPYCPTCSDRE